MQQPVKMRTFWKKTAVCITALLFAMALLPGLLSFSWAKKSALYCINCLIAGNISIDSLSLSWFGKQKIDGFYWQQGENVIQWKALKTDASLFRLFWGRSSSITTQFDALHLELSASNMPASFFAAPLASIKKGQLSLYDASFSLVEENAILPIMKDVELHWLSPTENSILCQIDGTTVQEKKQGKINVKIEYAKKAERSASTFFPCHSLQLHIEGERIPLQACSPLIQQWNKEVAHWLPAVVGDGLSLTFDTIMDAGTFKTALTANSSLAKLTIKGKCNEREFFLKEGSGQITLLPEVSNRLKAFFPLLEQWHIQKPTALSIRCNTLTLPLASWEGSLNEMLRAATSQGEIAVEGVKWSHHRKDKSRPSLSFNRIQANWVTEKESDTCSLSGKAEIKNKSHMPALLKFATTFSSCFDDFNHFALERVRGNATASLTAFPLRLIDGIMQSNTQPLIGSTFSLTAESEIMDGKAAIKANFDSEYLQAPAICCFLSLHGLAVDTPFAISHRFPKKRLNLGLRWGVVSEDKRISALRCSHDLAWQWHIDRAWIPFSCFPSQMVLHTRFDLAPFGLKKIPHVHHIATEPIALDLQIDTLQSIQFQCKGGIVSNPEGAAGILLGEKTAISLSGKAEVDTLGNVHIPHSAVHIDSDAVHYQSNFQYEDGSHLAWSPLSLSCLLSPQRFHLLASWFDLSSWTIAQECNIALKSEKGQYPLWEREGWKKTVGKATVAIDRIIPEYQEKRCPTLQAIEGKATRTKEGEPASFSLQSALFSEEEELPGEISAEGQVIHDDTTVIKGKVKADQRAITALEPFLNSSHPPISILGHAATYGADFFYWTLD